MKKVAINLIVLALYALFTIIMTWPVVGRLTTHVAGSGGDPWQALWRFETKAELLSQAWSKKQIASFAVEEFLGGGEPQLVNHSVWLWMPVHAAFGEPTAYNVIWILSFVLSGYAMYLLVRMIVSKSSKFSIFQPLLSAVAKAMADKKLRPAGSFQFSNTDVAAFLAGVAYAFLPYHVAHSYGHFGAMQLQWIPFIIALTISFFRRSSAWKAVGLGLLLLIQAWTEHHYFLWLMILAVIGALFYRKEIVGFWQQRSKKQEASSFAKTSENKGSRRAIIISIVFLLFSLVLITASYLPTARLALQDENPLSLGRQQLIRFSVDLFAPIVPAPFHSIWGPLSNKLFFRFFTGNVTESTQFLGIIPLLLIIFFHQKLPSRLAKFWLTVAAVFFLISLGPQLHVFGNVTPIHLPYELIDTWPIISSVRAVTRAGSIVGLSVMVLFGLVLATQLKRAGSAIAVFAVILLEFLFLPVPTQSAQLNPVYNQLKDMPGTRLVEIPAATNYTIASRALYASNRHGKEVVGNIALERALDQEAFEVARSAPALRQLLYLRTNTLQQDRAEFFDQDMTETLPDVLQWLDAHIILVHPDSLSELQLATVRQLLEERLRLTPQRYDDALLYNLSQGNLPPRDGVFLMRGDGWENVGFHVDRGSTFAEIPDRAQAQFINLNSSTVTVRVFFTIPAESKGSGQVLYAGQTAARLPANEESVSFTLEVPPGEHLIVFDTRSAEKIIIQNPKIEVIGNQ